MADPKILHTREEELADDERPYEAVFAGYNDEHRIDLDPGVMIGRPPPSEVRGPAVNVYPKLPVNLVVEDGVLMLRIKLDPGVMLGRDPAAEDAGDAVNVVPELPLYLEMDGGILKLRIDLSSMDERISALETHTLLDQTAT